MLNAHGLARILDRLASAMSFPRARFFFALRLTLRAVSAEIAGVANAGLDVVAVPVVRRVGHDGLELAEEAAHAVAGAVVGARACGGGEGGVVWEGGVGTGSRVRVVESRMCGNTVVAAFPHCASGLCPRSMHA